MERLEQEIKQLIVDTLRLEGMTVQGIDSEAALFGEGLGLDSIDALELAMAIRKKYGVRASGDDAENKKIFASVRTLAAHVSRQLSQANG